MCKTWHSASNRPDHLNLRGSIGHMIGATYNMGDAHIRIITNRGQSVQDLTIATDQNRIAHRGCINGQIAQNAIGPFNPRLVQLKTPMRRAVTPQCIALRIRQGQGRPVINRWFAHIQLFFAL